MLRAEYSSIVEVRQIPVDHVDAVVDDYVDDEVAPQQLVDAAAPAQHQLEEPGERRRRDLRVVLDRHGAGSKVTVEREGQRSSSLFIMSWRRRGNGSDGLESRPARKLQNLNRQVANQFDV